MKGFSSIISNLILVVVLLISGASPSEMTGV